LDLLLDQGAEALAAPCALADGFDDFICRWDADVRHDQQFFEAFEGIHVDGTRALLRGVSSFDERIKAFLELLRGARQSRLEFVK
jgi:hypothetical protein